MPSLWSNAQPIEPCFSRHSVGIMSTATTSNHRRCYSGVLIVRAAILCCTLTFIGFALAQPSNRPISSSGTQPDSGRGPLQQQPSVVAGVYVNPIQNPTDSTSKHNIDNESAIYWLARPDWWLVVLTAVLALVTWRLVVHTRQLAIDAGVTSKRQAEETAGAIAIAKEANRISNDGAIASRRAWVSIESVKLKPPTRFAEDGIVWGVEIMIKNVGLTPATRVNIRMESRMCLSEQKFIDAETNFKKSLRTHPTQLGDMLFPTETMVQNLTWAEDADKVGSGLTTRPNGDKLLGFEMFVGIAYWINGDDDAAHITYHCHSMLNVPVGTEIAAGQAIDFPRTPFLAGEAN